MSSSSFISSLRENQLEHFKRMIIILSRFHCAMDNSRMGSGKSYIAGAIAEAWKYKNVVVVCPASIEGQWRSILVDKLEEDVNNNIMSYESLRGTRNKSSSLLYCDGKDVYRPEKELDVLCENGTLFIFDESHRTKNLKSSIHNAVSAVVRCVKKWSTTTSTRALLLTGTPFDKEEHAFSLMSLCGFITSPELVEFDRSLRVLRLTGVRELIDFCKKDIDYSISSPYNIKDRKTAAHFIFNVVTEIIMPEISASMVVEKEHLTSSESSSPVLDCKNKFIVLNGVDFEHFSENVNNLSSAIGFDEATGKITTGGIASLNWGAITKSLMGIEFSKIGAITNEVINKAREIPLSKIVVALNYIESVESVATRLRLEFPNEEISVITGSVAKSTRSEAFKKFQNGSLRFIIANLQVIALGVDLDDQVGDRPRFAYASPSYFTINQHQFVRRFIRLHTKGVATVRFVYGKQQQHEESPLPERKLISAISNKAKVIRVGIGETTDNILFADQYETENIE